MSYQIKCCQTNHVYESEIRQNILHTSVARHQEEMSTYYLHLAAWQCGQLVVIAICETTGDFTAVLTIWFIQLLCNVSSHHDLINYSGLLGFHVTEGHHYKVTVHVRQMDELE